MKVRLIKIEERTDATHPNNIETGFEVAGEAPNEPKVGECFWVYPSISRYWRTSTVQEILGDNTFKTLNSVYKWEVIE